MDQRAFKKGVVVVDDLHQLTEVFVDAFKIDEFEHGFQLVVAAQLVDFFLRGFPLGQGIDKPVDGEVVDQGIGIDGRLQHKTFKRGATAQGHIHLSVGEGLSRVDDDLVESQALALMDGNGPSQTQRYLGEATDFLFLDVLVFCVDGVLHVLPGQFGHDDALAIALHGDGAFVIVVADQPPDFAVIEGLFRVGVVFDEHHLCPDFQHQFFLGGVGVFGESAAHHGLENQRFCFDSRQLRLVDLVGLVVMRRQGDVAFVVVGDEVRFETAVEQAHTIGIHLVITYFVQKGDKILIVLAVDVFQLHADVRGLFQHLATEEVGCVVIRRQHLPFLGLGHGCELVHVANHQQLQPAKGFLRAAHAT